MPSIDPTLYAGAPLDPQEVAAQDVAGLAQATPVVPDLRPAVPVTAGVTGTELDLQGIAAREAAARPLSTPFEAVHGAISTMATTGVLRYFTDPTFEPETGYNLSDQMKAAPFVFSKEEAAYVADTKSTAEGRYKIERIKQTREAHQAMGDRPALAMTVAMLDPVWFLAGGAALKTADTAVQAAGLARRAVGATLGAAEGAAIGLATQGTRPMSDTEVFLGAVLEAGAGAAFVSRVNRRVATAVPAEDTPAVFSTNRRVAPTTEAPTVLVPKDPDFPAAALRDHADALQAPVPAPSPVFTGITPTQVAGAAVAAGVVATATVDPEKAAELGLIGGAVLATKGHIIPPKHLQSLHGASTAAEVEAATTATVQAQAEGWAKTVGAGIEWNIRKTMHDFSDAGKKVSDTLFDNNADLSKHSVESHKRAVQADLTKHKWVFDDLLQTTLAEQGAGLMRRIFSTAAAGKQAEIEHAVSMEMFRRGQLSQQGLPISHVGVPEHITKMADAADSMHRLAADELIASGVEGAEALKHKTGYFNRRWDSSKVDVMLEKFTAAGLTAKEALNRTIDLVSSSMRSANGWNKELADDVAGATVNRAISKGMFEDSAFNASVGAETAVTLQKLLVQEGLSGARLQRVMDVLVGKMDESGKVGFMKHRVDLDYNASTVVNGETLRVTDLLDTNISGLMDRYIDSASAQIAFAKKGLTKPSDITALRTELITSLKGNPVKQKEAVDLFEASIDHLYGRPSGVDIGTGLRNVAAVNRMITLGASGYWQLSEYATLMAQYGALKSIKYAMQELPGFKGMLEYANSDVRTSQNLKDILTNAADQNLRLRPYLQRFEDGFDTPLSHTLTAKLQQAQQLVPYANGMKYVHGHQARLTANLIIDTINSAVKGDAKAAKALEKYGVDATQLRSMADDVKQHGMAVDKWADGSWASVRPAFMKMLDESVLHQRMGDMPAFAMLNPVGKFIFTYRSFVLTAHNKILSGGLQRDGFAGVGLMLAYQFPLAALAVQAQATVNGKKAMTEKELAAKAIGQMGGIGLASEVWGFASGSKREVGSPGMIPFDRPIKAAQSVASATFGAGSSDTAIKNVVGLLPILAVLPPLKAMQALALEDAP